MPLLISAEVREKIAAPSHGCVTPQEVAQCFQNHTGHYCTDAREQHRTMPPTQWFVGETNRRRRLKIMFVREGSDIRVKSAYLATDEVTRIFRKFAGRA